MTVLVLCLRGPMQSWGSSSRFVRRTTEPHPTKSGVVGLLAAALGRRRTDPIEDLVALRLGVRLDQPGRLLRDFQTARPKVGKPMPLSQRYYLADGVFVAFVEGDPHVLATLNEALHKPAFPLFLGRRSCPPVGPVTMGVRDLALDHAITEEPWRASRWLQRRTMSAEVQVETVVDASLDALDAVSLPDAPVSFDPCRRLYALRPVTRGWVTVPNPEFVPAAARPSTTEHDSLAAIGGA